AASAASVGYSAGSSHSAGRQSRSKIVVPRWARSAASVVSRLGGCAGPVAGADRSGAAAAPPRAASLRGASQAGGGGRRWERGRGRGRRPTLRRGGGAQPSRGRGRGP